MKQEQAETLFNAARTLSDPTQRAAFLDAACVGNTELRERVETLLAAETSANAYFDRRAHDPGLDPGKTDVGGVSSVYLSHSEKLGERIGRYKLRERVGEGGCGVVYVADQEEPVRRRVALKVIKLGMDTRQVVARFEAERQALALMDHPNIAKVLDAGATDTGRPYFVMELVRGIRITDYCDQNKLSTTERVDLVVQVCNAVQHAHQKGIIHRDLKPSNILITLHDGVAVPKIIDFGIAKATEGRLTDLTVYTELHQFIGTPAYMSPEQAEMSGLDIDTRSDIYSLGVLLYELLTGRTPFDAKELIASGLDSMRKTIREQEPVRPSTKLASLASEDLTTTAKRRSAESAKLLHELRGDLDWIVMKCLEKDRTRRYETANGMAMDLRRHRHHEPVVARPPSAAYRFQKFVRRNSLVFAGVSAIATVLVFGLVTSAFLAVRATRERERAVIAQQNEQQQRQVAQAQSRLAEENRRKAQENEVAARRNLYAAKMSLAKQAWDENKILHLRQLLKETQDHSDRGFEWYYWQRQTHLELRTFRGHLDRVFSAAFSPDGQRIVTASVDHTAKVWEAMSGRELFPLIGHKSWVINARYSPDGRMILTGSTDQTLKLWDSATGEHLHTFTDQAGPIGNAAFSSDSRRIIVGSFDRTAKVYDAQSGRTLLSLPSHPSQVDDVAFSPDDQRIITTAGHNDFKLRVWNATNGLLLHTLSGHTGPSVVTFSPDGERFASGSWDRSAIIWDAKSCRPVLTNKLHLEFVRGVAFSPDSRRIATASFDMTAKVWDPDTGRVHFTLKGHVNGLESVAFSPNGQWILTAGNDQTAKMWDATRDPEVLTLRGHTGPIRAVAFSPDSQRLLTASDDKTIKIWDATSGRETANFPGHIAAVRCAAFSPDGKRVVSGSTDLTARVWNAVTGQLLFSLPGHIARINSVAFSRDGRRIVTASADQTVKLWNAITGVEILTIPEQGAPIGAAGFSADGNYVLTAGEDVRLWDAITGKLVRSLERFPGLDPGLGIANVRSAEDLRLWAGAVGFAAVSPDGQFVAGGRGSTAGLWELDSGRAITRFEGHVSAIFSLAFSPDGRRLVTGGGSHAKNGGSFAVAKIWDTITGRELLTFSGHTDAVYSVAFSPDGSRIATGSGDSTVRLCQAATREQVSNWLNDEQSAAERLTAAGQERQRHEDLQRVAWAHDDGAIKEWLLLAPILPRKGETGPEAFEREMIPHEAQIRPQAGNTQVLEDETFVWRKSHFDDGMIRIDSWFGEVVPTSLVYAVCYIVAETDLHDLQVRIGANQPKLYLNGNTVPIPFQVNFFVEDLNVVRGVSLKRGVNTVVLKFGGGFGSPYASLRFADLNGQPLKGIKVTLNP